MRTKSSFLAVTTALLGLILLPGCSDGITPSGSTAPPPAGDGADTGTDAEGATGTADGDTAPDGDTASDPSDAGDTGTSADPGGTGTSSDPGDPGTTPDPGDTDTATDPSGTGDTGGPDGPGSGDDVEPEWGKDVPYFCQYDNATAPGSTCNVTCMAMVLAYYGADVTPDYIDANYGGYSKTMSVSGWEDTFNAVARDFDLPVRDDGTTTGTLEQIHDSLRRGYPVVAHGYFTAGHIIVLVGYDGEYYYANDPAGNWDGTYMGGFVPRCSDNTVGKYTAYRADAVERAILGDPPDGQLWIHLLQDV